MIFQNLQSRGANLDDPQLALHTNALLNTELASITVGTPLSLLRPLSLHPRAKQMLSLGQIPVVPPSSHLVAIDWNLLHEHEAVPVNLNQTRALALLEAVMHNQTNPNAVLNYRHAIQNAGDQGVQVVQSLVLGGHLPLAISNANLTSAMLAPLVDLVPPSVVAPGFLLRLMSNVSIPEEVREVVVRACVTLPCPDAPLFQYLTFLVVNTSSVHADTNDTNLLWDEAANALAIFSNRSDCSVSFLERAGFPTTINEAAQRGAAFWQHEKLLRLTHVPCSAGMCSVDHVHETLHTTLGRTQAPDDIEILINAIANLGLERDEKFLLDSLQHPSAVWRAVCARSLRRLPPDRAVAELR